MDEYGVLTSRNWGFIDGDTQSKLRHASIFLAGCGLGCNIARDLAALGVGRFVVCDGDIVERSNLNRQAYYGHHLGTNKAEATADIIKGVNPETEVVVFPKYIDGMEEIEPLLRGCDFVVNTVDYQASVFLPLTDFSRELGKTVFFPTNVGWGAVVMVFNHNSISMADYLRVSPGTKCDLGRFLLRLTEDWLPSHLKPLYDSFVSGGVEAWPSIPQIMPGAQLVSVIVSRLVVSALQGVVLDVAPKFYELDAALL